MGCKYWECKYNNLTKKGEITDCGKPNEPNFVQPCPDPSQIGDYCVKGELRNTDMFAEKHKNSSKSVVCIVYY